MKRKLLSILLAVLMAISVFALSSCEILFPVDPPTDENDEAFREVYELYVDYAASNGQTPDSYEDWLNSIRGEDGKDGKPGKDGADGEDGLTPSIGENGNWWIGDVDTGVSALPKNGEDGTDGKDGVGIEKIEKISSEGLVDTYEITYTTGTKFTFTVTNGQNGIDGEDGRDGVDGTDGITPLLRITDGYWEVSYDNGTTWTSLGVKASGEQGPQGEKGETGEQGPQGEPGKDGVGIAKIEKISSEGLVDTYEITYTDGTKTTFTITNGENGADGEDLTACEHEFWEWISVYEPSCDCIGISYRTCTKCNQVEHKYIEKLGHTMVDVYTMVNTCTRHTVMTKCSVCNVAFVEDREIEVDHNYVDGTCTMCGDTTIVATPDEYFTFTLLADDTYSVSAKDIYNIPQNVVIPEKHNGKDVTSFGLNAFYNCINLTSIIIPNSVTSIDGWAFYNCINLTSIIIPDSVISIDSNAFQNTAYYTNDSNWENNVLYIGNYLIKAKKSISNEYIIKDGTIAIADSAFYDCTSLVSVYIPDSVISIGSYAFYNTAYYNDADNWDNGVLYVRNHLIAANSTAPSEYVIKDGTIVIADSAFSYYTSYAPIEKVTIPNSVTYIGDHAFSECSSLTNITIPRSVVSIGYNAFYGCNFESIIVENGNKRYHSNVNCLIETNTRTLLKASRSGIVPDDGSVDSIGYGAFAKYSNLSSVIMPDSVTYIGDGAFFGCVSLENINIPGNTTYIGNTAFFECDSLTNVIIPNKVTFIGDYAFYSCDNLVSIIIPNSVIHVGDRAFESCSSLSDITMGNGVTYVGTTAFHYTAYYNDDNNWIDGVLYIDNHLLEAKNTVSGEYAVKEGTITISSNAFVGCGSLTNIFIPASVTYIGEKVFPSSLLNISLDDNNKYYRSIDGNLYNKDETIFIKYAASKENTTFNISENVIFIEDSAFYDCDSLTSVTIPNGVTFIGDSAFYDCDSLVSVDIPDSVTSIGEMAFYSCDSLESVVIGDSVTSIGYFAFSDCDSLIYVTFSDSVTIMGERAFDFKGTSSLGQIYYKGNVKKWFEREIYTAFSYSSNYELHFIGEGGNEITEIIIPNNITSVLDYALKNAKNVTSVTIPNSVTYISPSTFAGCSSIEQFIVESGNTKYYVKENCLIESDTGILVKGSKYGVIPNDENIVALGSYAFSTYSSFENIIIPNNIKSIGERAFAGCSNLISITIPESITFIGERAFQNCTSLVSITIPSGVTSIESYVFSNCKSLTKIIIPNNVTSIGKWAFNKCSSLTDVYYTGTEEEWRNINIGTYNSSLTDATIHYNYVPEE